MKKSIHTSILLLLIVYSFNQHSAQPSLIQNDTFWFTKEGQPIYSQGGGIFRFKDPSSGIEKYYWYGVRYKEAETYRLNPAVTLPTSSFENVTCYSSTDLVNWTEISESISLPAGIRHGTILQISKSELQPLLEL